MTGGSISAGLAEVAGSQRTVAYGRSLRVSGVGAAVCLSGYPVAVTYAGDHA